MTVWALGWIAWLTFSTGEQFGVAALSRADCVRQSQAVLFTTVAADRAQGVERHVLIAAPCTQVLIAVNKAMNP